MGEEGFMWIKAIVIGVLIGLALFAVSLRAQPSAVDEQVIMQKLDQIIEKQNEMMNH